MVSKRLSSDFQRSSGISRESHGNASPQTSPPPARRRTTRASGPLESLHRVRRSTSLAVRQPVDGAGASRPVARGPLRIAAAKPVPADSRGRIPDVDVSRLPTRAPPLPSKRGRGVETRADPRTTFRPGPRDASALHSTKRARYGRALVEPSASRRMESGHEPTREQLIGEDAGLDRAARSRLSAQHKEQCGRLQHLAKQARQGRARSQKVDPKSCLQLAQDNILAQRNGYGLALVFLSRVVSSEENTRRVTDYFLVLSAAAPQASPSMRQDLQRCADVAAHYLSKTNWFEGTPLYQLVHVSNLLSKYADRPACLNAIAWVAGQVLMPEVLPRLSAKQLSLLANAFSKNQGSEHCEQAVARIGRHVLQDRVGEYPAQSVSMLLNAFSKWPGNLACRTATERLAERLADDADLRQIMTAQAVANSLNALGKWPDSTDCRAAAECLATRLIDDDSLRQALDGAQVANSIGAMGRWPDSGNCRAAAERLAARLTDDAKLRQNMSAQQVAGSLNGLSKWPDAVDCRTAAGHLAARLASDAKLRRDMNAQEVANALGALGKWPDAADCLTAAERLAVRLAGSEKLLLAMKSQLVSNALNGLSKWPDSIDCRTAAECLAIRLLDDDGQLLADLDVQGVANSLNALSKWPDASACRATAEPLAARIVHEPALGQSMNVQQFGNALNALGKWPDAADCRAAAERLALRLTTDAKLCRTLNARGVANALNALSKWPDATDCRAAAERLATRLTDDAGLLDALDAQGMANALNALGKWPDAAPCRAAADRLAARLTDDAGLRRTMNALQITGSLTGLSKWPDSAGCRAAAECLAAQLADDAMSLQGMDARKMANALNALSKWPDSTDCHAAAERLAARLAGNAGLLQAMDAQGMANALNALAKWPDSADCRAAAECLAAQLAGNAALLQAMSEQHLTNSLNALSKWPEAVDCRAAAEHLAAQLTGDAALQRSLGAWQVANLLNALSKWPDAADCRTAAECLAARLVRDADLLQALSVQALSLAFNALGKWPDSADCRAAAEHLAAWLADDAELTQAMDAQAVANALGGLGKWSDSADCRAVAEHLAARLATDARLRQDMSAQQVASSLNGLSKWPGSTDCRIAAERLAARLVDEPALLQAMHARPVANALNALSKWPDVAACGAAAQRLAARLASSDRLPQAMNEQEVANALNALGKWRDVDDCRAAAASLAARLADDAALRQALNAQGVANALNGLSKWPQNEACQAAAIRLVDDLGSGGRLFSTFDLPELAQLANGMARFALAIGDVAAHERDAELTDGTPLDLMHTRLRELAAHLNVRPDGLNHAGTRAIAMVFKALASAGLQDGQRLLARQGLQRLQALQAQTGFKPDNLETLGSLAAGLLPLVRSPELKPYRRDALRLLGLMQPDVARKVQCYVDAHAASPSPAVQTRPAEDEAFGTRLPGLTFFLLLKTYTVVASLWKARYVSDIPARVAEQREALKAWIGRTLEPVRGHIEGDLDEMSWNLIAQIEAGDNVLDALDLKLWRDLDRIVAAHPPTPLDVAAVRRELRGLPEVRDLLGNEAGAARLQIIDMHGRDVRTSTPTDASGTGAQPYSFFTRLTGGRLPLVEVELPGQLSAFMLARTIRHGDDLLRMDLFGGSHLTPSTTRVFERLAGAQSIKRYGRLPAVRLADTVPNAPLMKDVIRKLNPQREDWYRMQRALLEIVPRDHVVEGPVRLALLADRPQGAEPAFALRTPEGEPIRLVSHDGCGFVRESLARRIPAVARAMDAWSLSRQKGSDAAPALRMVILPSQATHHYPRNEAVIEEARTHLRHALHTDTALWETDAFSGTRKLSKPKLYDLLVGAGISGTQGVAVPSADGKLYLPGEKGAGFDRTGGPVLLGKPPYDKPNLMPIPAERVGTSAQGDATARFLETAFAFQYSYTAWDESQPHTAGHGDDAPMLHGKGVTIVVPDALWPQDNDAQWVWSTEDMKIHSSWTQRRERDRLPARMNTVGSLRVKDVYTPGSLIAVPVDELKKRDADCDGDRVFVYAGLPKMAQAIAGFFEERERQVGKVPSFKPPKTASAAFDEAGQYRAGRAAEVLSAVRGQELVRRMSTLQFHFWGQPQAVRERIAESAIFGTYEGTRRELRRGLRRLLYDPAEATPDPLQALRERARLGVEHAHHPVAREAAEVLLHQLEAFSRDAHGLREPAAPPPALSPTLAERFTSLAEAYTQAGTPRERLAALAEHYPTALLPHPGTALPSERPAAEQLGYAPEAPLETLRNLLTLGVKVGTDAPKAATQTGVYLKIADRLEHALRREQDRIRLMPYTKSGLLPKLRDGLNAQAEQHRLRDNPTLAAGLMEMALEELLERRLIDGVPTPGALSADTETQLRQLAHGLHMTAAQAEAEMTALVRHAIRGIGVLCGEAHCLKSESSLFDKLRRMMRKTRQTPQAAAAGVGDTLRYSVVLPPETFVLGYAGILGILDAAGLTQTRVHNSFVKSNAAFKGVNVKLTGRDTGGNAIRLEIQFHTERTFELKERFHDAYKQTQAQQLAGASREDQLGALAEARRAFGEIATPQGCEHITDWETAPPHADRPRAPSAAAPRLAAAHAQTALGEHVQRLAAQARIVHQEVGPLLAALETHEDLDLRVDKHHSVPKQTASIRKKIERYQVLEGLSLEQASARVRDAMRWIVLLPANRFGIRFAHARQRLEQQGLRVTRINNGFTAPDRTYAGLNVTWRTAAGSDFEIQFHTAQSLNTRNTSHKTYRKWQDLEVNIALAQDPAERQALQQANARLLSERKAQAAAVALPEGIQGIPSIRYDSSADAPLTASGRTPQPIREMPDTEPHPRRAPVLHGAGLPPPRAGTAPGSEVRDQVAAALGPHWQALRWELAGTGIALEPSVQPERLDEQLQKIQHGLERKTARDLQDLAGNPGLRLDWARREPLYRRVVDSRARLGAQPPRERMDPLYDTLRKLDTRGRLRHPEIERHFSIGAAQSGGDLSLFDSLYQVLQRRDTASGLQALLAGTSIHSSLGFGKYMQGLLYRGGLPRPDQDGRNDPMDLRAASVVMTALADLLDLQMVFLQRRDDGRVQLNPPVGSGTDTVFLLHEIALGTDGRVSPLWIR
ncbi:XopAD/skwp family type III secretion system effector [Ralstonia nicotianae]